MDLRVQHRRHRRGGSSPLVQRVPSCTSGLPIREFDRVDREPHRTLLVGGEVQLRDASDGAEIALGDVE
jgi:hypothetical protein